MSYACRSFGSLRVSFLLVYSCYTVHTVPRSASDRSSQRPDSTGWGLHNPSHPTTLYLDHHAHLSRSYRSNQSARPSREPPGFRPWHSQSPGQVQPSSSWGRNPAMMTDPNPPSPCPVAPATVLLPTTSCPAGSYDSESSATINANRERESRNPVQTRRGRMAQQLNRAEFPRLPPGGRPAVSVLPAMMTMLPIAPGEDVRRVRV